MITQAQIDFVIQQIASVSNPDSDLDILVIKNSTQERHLRTKEIRKSLRGCKIPLDILVYTPEEIQAWQGVNTCILLTINVLAS